MHWYSKVTDPKQIAELILEAEKRIVQAEHYGIPYARPDHVAPQTAYSKSCLSLFFLLYFSILCLLSHQISFRRQHCQQTVPEAHTKAAKVNGVLAFVPPFSTTWVLEGFNCKLYFFYFHFGIVKLVHVPVIFQTAVVFTRRYFAGSRISDEILNDVVKLCTTNAEFYTSFVNKVLCSDVLEKYPIRKSYRRKLLKQMIDAVSSYIRHHLSILILV